MTSYDENLQDNPYHQKLHNDHPELLNQISLKGWTICIPRSDSITTPVTTKDIHDHIVQPTGINLTGKQVTLNNSKIQHNGNTINILFKERFHLKNLRYSVYCIEHPLTTHPTSKIKSINNLSDAINFLPTNTCMVIEETCDAFLLEHDLPSYPLKQLQEAYQILYNRTLMATLKQQNDLSKKQPVSILDSLNLTVDQFDRNGLNNFKLSVAVYMQHSLKNAIFQSVSNACAHLDAAFNKTTRNLQHVTCYNESIPAARCEMNRLNHTMIVAEKIACLRNCFRVFSGNKKSFNSDDLLQLLTVLIVKSHFSNWIANLVYLQMFNCSDGKGEEAFLVTSLEAAVEFIKSGELGGVEVCSMDGGLFGAVARCDLDFVKREFEKDRVELVELCHPLCDCQRCSRVIDGSGGFNVRDDKGRTLLHHGCIYGYPHMVDFLLQTGVEIDAVDYFGGCAVHHAAGKGHQNALLLLLHSGAGLNVVDCDGNTPLHLAVNNGHDSCVKAILYFAEQKGYGLGVNMLNNSGDSALHLAAKWGYISILSILLQYNADCHVTNKRNQRPVDLSHSCDIRRLLLNIQTKTDETIEDSGKISGLLLKAIEYNDLPLACFYMNNPNVDLNDALHAAAKFGRTDIFRLLIEEGVDVNTKTRDLRQTVLHVACKMQRANVVKELLSQKCCEINHQDTKGNTAMHYACLKNDFRICEMLINHGADTTLRNADGKGVLDIAKSASLFNITKLLVGRIPDEYSVL